MERLVDVVAGARPNFMKLAPVHKSIDPLTSMKARIVHTGQHYDDDLSDVFFRELGIPNPDFRLEVGSGPHGAQTARVLERYEALLLDSPPDCVVVFGDVNSTVACALAAVKLGIPVAHVEAGLRSFDRSMPEEINRVITDAISNLLFVSEPSGVTNLQNEGVSADRLRLVGNVMIDTLFSNLERARKEQAASHLGLAVHEYCFVTLHRPANIDSPSVLEGLAGALEEISKKLHVVFPMHPRTSAALERGSLRERLVRNPRVHALGPLPYLRSLSLVLDSAMVLTDSGGLQEETSALGVPCLTLRDNTERPLTVEEGTNRLVGSDPRNVLAAFNEAFAHRLDRVPTTYRLWDGKAADRIAAELEGWLDRG